VITVRNASKGTVHDLVLDTGAKSGRLAPGESAVVDVGVVGRNIDGWCSVAGHRQMGMVLTIKVKGAQHDTPSPDSGSSRFSGHSTGEHPHDTDDGPRATYAPGAPRPEDVRARDARRPAAPAGRLPRVRHGIGETDRAAAPGVR